MEKGCGKTRHPLAKRLAVIYGCTLNELLGYTEEIIETTEFKIQKRD